MEWVFPGRLSNEEIGQALMMNRLSGLDTVSDTIDNFYLRELNGNIIFKNVVMHSYNMNLAVVNVEVYFGYKIHYRSGEIFTASAEDQLSWKLMIFGSRDIGKLRAAHSFLNTIKDNTDYFKCKYPDFYFQSKVASEIKRYGRKLR